MVSQRQLLSIHNQSEGNTSSLSQFEKIDFQSRYLKKLELSLQQQVDSQMCTSIPKIRFSQKQHSRKSRGLTPKGNSMQTDTRPSLINEKYLDAGSPNTHMRLTIEDKLSSMQTKDISIKVKKRDDLRPKSISPMFYPLQGTSCNFEQLSAQFGCLTPTADGQTQTGTMFKIRKFLKPPKWHLGMSVRLRKSKLANKFRESLREQQRWP